MYFEHSTPTEVKRQLQEYLNETRAELAAWQSVTIERKKDGTEMAQLGRAIRGAKLSTAYPAHDATHPALYVYFSANNKYCENHIKAYYYCDTLPDKGASREIVYNGGFLRATSPMTAQELREAIKKQIEMLSAFAESYEKQIAICEAAFIAYRTAIDKAERDLKTICEPTKYPNETGETSLYYAITSRAY